jgi:hypothetical protein
VRFLFRLVRRLTWLVTGILVGWASSLAVTRRFRRATRRFRLIPTRERVRDEVRAAVREGRTAMRAREAELRGPPPPAK